MKWIGVVALLALGACGVDGAPIRPTGGVGVTLGSDGVSTSATVGAQSGPVTVILGL